jgi:hypothetical protein
VYLSISRYRYGNGGGTKTAALWLIFFFRSALGRVSVAKMVENATLGQLLISKVPRSALSPAADRHLRGANPVLDQREISEIPSPDQAAIVTLE